MGSFGPIYKKWHSRIDAGYRRVSVTGTVPLEGRRALSLIAVESGTRQSIPAVVWGDAPRKKTMGRNRIATRF
jgi:hypothetical protein